MAPTGIQLFVEELFSFSLLKIFGLLLHCEGLPLWNGQQHNFSSLPLPLNLLDSCCSRTSTNNHKNHGLVLKAGRKRRLTVLAIHLAQQLNHTDFNSHSPIFPNSDTCFQSDKNVLDFNQSASLMFKKAWKGMEVGEQGAAQENHWRQERKSFCEL